MTAARWTHPLRLFLESALALGMGAFFIMLTWSSVYWRFLNPKFQWVTFAAGALLALLGLAAVFAPRRPASWSTLAAATVFLGLAYGALTITPTSPFDVPATAAIPQDDELARLFAQEDAPPRTFSGAPRRQDAPTGPLTIDGETHTPINLAELMTHLDTTPDAFGEPYVVRGQALRHPALDAAGQIALTRLMVVCCFADAVAVAQLVAVEDPAAYADGQWLQAAGRVRLLGEPVMDVAELRRPDALATVTEGDRVLEPTRLVPTQPPALPYIFEMREAPPFAY